MRRKTRSGTFASISETSELPVDTEARGRFHMSANPTDIILLLEPLYCGELAKMTRKSIMKRAFSLLLVAVAATCASTTASAHASVGVYFGGPVYAAPPPVYYQPYAPPVIYQSYPPPVVYQPPPVVYGPPPGVYGYGYGYRGGYRGEDWDHRRWHD